MKYKNVFGELEYELGNFFVPHRKGSTGKYRILKHAAWCVVDAISVEFFSLPEFDSWIQAIRYLKENVDCLI